MGFAWVLHGSFYGKCMGAWVFSIFRAGKLMESGRLITIRPIHKNDSRETMATHAVSRSLTAIVRQRSVLRKAFQLLDPCTTYAATLATYDPPPE